MQADHSSKEHSGFEFSDKGYLLLFGAISAFFLPICELGYAAIKRTGQPDILRLSLCSYATSIISFVCAVGFAIVCLYEFKAKWVRLTLCVLVTAAVGVSIGEARYWLPQLICDPHTRLSDVSSVWGFALAWQLPSIKAKTKSSSKRPLL